MAASGYEQELAPSAGVRIVCGAAPVADRRQRRGCARSSSPTPRRDGRAPTGETFTLAADQVLTAIGQRARRRCPAGSSSRAARSRSTGPGRTGLPGVWAGGDCAAGGDDLTVTAVAEGRDAAMDIHAALTARPMTRAGRAAACAAAADRLPRACNASRRGPWRRSRRTSSTSSAPTRAGRRTSPSCFALRRDARLPVDPDPVDGDPGRGRRAGGDRQPRALPDLARRLARGAGRLDLLLVARAALRAARC